MSKDSPADMTPDNLLEWRIPIRYDEFELAAHQSSLSDDEVQFYLAVLDVGTRSIELKWCNSDWIDEYMETRRWIDLTDTGVTTADMLDVAALTTGWGTTEEVKRAVRLAHVETINRYTKHYVKEGLVIWGSYARR